MSNLFISDDYKPQLSRCNFADFNAIWDHEIDWYEEPNERRGGWSGVGRVDLVLSDGNALSLFVKKQQNHGRRTLRSPIKGEPTFRREFKRLIYLSEHNFAAPNVVLYGEFSSGENQRALLVTVALDDYQSLEEILSQWWSSANAKKKSSLIAKVAIEIKRFHDLGLTHRALYPKHIFIKNFAYSPEIALIDLEKARFNFFSSYRAYFDLAALSRHSFNISARQKLTFFKQYLGIKKMNSYQKFLCRLIVKRSKR